ncbi:hypothetical protein Sdia_11360 [Streptomyces diastaticus subsp. diastaticus]|uniref:Uncharacterized protein n=1 Tax=Streptomyces diastaticus subsp. diastaticus TaxID=68040 RepID=A0ABQ1CJW1_STRDI|nr:hypothetical protein Sdia_11360 [Streptomyces diastaticus subsp. diastaticus]GGU16990.1 hypothetical protein GCM10015534_19810 [Streptomyces diastaticus subsp. diastaticus]
MCAAGVRCAGGGGVGGAGGSSRNVPSGVGRPGAGRRAPGVDAGMCDGLVGKDSGTLMEQTVVRCADGHVFSTASFPMQQLGTGRIGPGRLIRCPRCARLRQAVPVAWARGTA